MNHVAPASAPARRDGDPRTLARGRLPEFEEPPVEVAPAGGQPPSRKVVYTVIEEHSGRRARWVKVGIAFVNRDGSYTVRLDALPVNGMLHIRDFPPRDVDEAGE